MTDTRLSPCPKFLWQPSGENQHGAKCPEDGVIDDSVELVQLQNVAWSPCARIGYGFIGCSIRRCIGFIAMSTKLDLLIVFRLGLVGLSTSSRNRWDFHGLLFYLKTM